MSKRVVAIGLVLAIFGASLIASGSASGRPSRKSDRLELYTVTGSAQQLEKLDQAGYDPVDEGTVDGRPSVDVVLSHSQAAKLRGRGYGISLWRNQDGRTAQQLASAQALGGYRVWRSWDETGGIEDQILEIAANNPRYVKLVKLPGQTYGGRDFLALKVTENARQVPDGSRPASVFSSTQHAREWISTEVNRRILRYVVAKSRQKGALRNLLAKRELWFYLVANPDGYEYSFDVDRLWRKNLRDNNGVPGVQVGDGVDPNRNFPNHWNYDDEGSSGTPSDETYRGPGPASEPETKAMMALLDRSEAEFLVNFHSFGNLLLYSFGWQVQTTSSDDPIFKALSGTDDKPAIQGRNETQRLVMEDATGGTFTLTFESDDERTDDTTAPIPHNATAAQIEAALEALPDAQDVWGERNLSVQADGGPLGSRAVFVSFRGLRVKEDVPQLEVDGSALEGDGAQLRVFTNVGGVHGLPPVDPGPGADLYTTNGETTDYAHGVGTLAWTPELDDGEGNNGFVFPDSPRQVQAEFRRYLPFAKDVMRSAADPARPSSHLGNKTKPMYVNRFDESWGDPQTVQVTARRDLGPVKLRYRINRGPVQTRSTSEWHGGERFGDAGDLYYRVMRGKVRGTSPGDKVQVWFTAARTKSGSFTYLARKESDNDVLILASEDYKGGSNLPPYESTTSLNYIDYYKSALSDMGITADVYDLDATADDPADRTAPDALGVLKHYDVVINYTGNDNVTRHPEGLPGTMAAVANQEMLELRSYLNEGGRLLYTGGRAGRQYETSTQQEWSPTGDDTICDGALFSDDDPTGTEDCIQVTNDFHQYYLGAYLYNTDGGLADFETGDMYPIAGTDQPFSGLANWTLDQGNSAGNQWDGVVSGIGPGSMLSTSSILKPEIYPQFESWAAAEYLTGVAGQFEPHTGNWYLYSDRSDLSYKRLRRTVNLSDVSAADAPKLRFWYSADTEPDWDMVFVEARPAGSAPGKAWTTLPDENGATTQDTGLSCADPDGDGNSWIEDPDDGGVHPWLRNYMTFHEDSQTCDPVGTTGEWHAFSGNSHGWQEFVVDLSDYAGGSVQLSISYASDWGFQGLGLWLDDVSITTDDDTLHETSFEEGLGGWRISPAPFGSDPNANDYFRTQSVGYEVGAAIATTDTLYLGFGIEGVDGADKRSALIKRAMDYLLR
jgi:Zinc carboxypeptidase